MSTPAGHDYSPQPPAGSPGDAMDLIGVSYIAALRENELRAAALYDLFARKYPSAGGFWLELAGEERAHAEVLRQISGLVETGRMFMKRPGGFSLADVKQSIEWMDKLMEVFLHEGMDMKAALDSALRVEMDMVESGFFEIAGSNDPEMAAEFTALKEHTKRHIEKIAAERKSARWHLFG